MPLNGAEQTNSNMKKVKLFEEYIQEATTSWGKMMKGVRAGDGGPWSIVAIQDRKVVGQSNDIKIQDLIPAKYEALKAEFPKAKLHIEDAGGGVVWNESLNEEFDISTIKAKDTIELTNTRTGDVGKYTVKRIFGGSSNIKEIEVLTRNKQLLTLYYSKERGLQNFKGDVYESFINEVLAAADKSKLTNKVEITVAIARTLMNNARTGKLKHMSAPGGVTHYWNPTTKEYVGRTEQEGRLNQGTFFFSNVLNKEGNLTESFMNEGIDSMVKNLETMVRKQFNVIEFKAPAKRPLIHEEFLMIKVSDDKYGGPQSGLGKFIKKSTGVEASFVDSLGSNKTYWISLEKLEDANIKESLNEASTIQKDLASKIHNAIEGDEDNKRTILNAMHRTQNQFDPLTVNIATGYEGSAGMDNRLDRLRTLSPTKLNLILKELNTILGVKESLNEAVDATRDELMDLMETKYKIKTVRTSEDFNGQTGGIWIAADNEETMGGNKIFDYYNRSSKYSNGVLTQLRTAVEKKGWWFEWNDPGTIICWPKN